MKFQKMILTLMMCVMFLAGCSAKPREVDDERAKQIAKQIKYLKDHRVGLCYGVIAVSVNGIDQDGGLGMTEVPCDKVNNLLVNP